MHSVKVNAFTFRLIQVASRSARRPESAVVEDAMLAFVAATDGAPDDPWTELDVWACYLGTRVEARYLPANGRMRIVTGPCAGSSYNSPSGAAAVVVAALNPGRDPRTNGWRFWHLRTGALLATIQPSGRRRR